MKLTVDQALQKGIEAHKAGKVQEADRHYTAILRAQPKHADANHNMGVLAVGLGRVQEALPFFKTALEANPAIAQYWLSYINAFIKLDRISDAKAVFEQAKSKGAKGEVFDQIEKRLGGVNKIAAVNNSRVQDPPADQLQNLINLYTQGQYQEALTLSSQMLKVFSKSTILYNIIGSANQSLRKLDAAIAAYKKAISIDPDDADIYNNMGNALKDQGKLDAAIDAYKKAVSINPESAVAHNNMGITLQERGKLDVAIAAYKKAISINPNSADTYYNMGNALRDQGKLNAAIEAYSKAISINPDYAVAYNNMGNILQEQDKLDAAIEAYNKAVTIKPDYPEAHNNMGNSLQEQGKLGAAIEAYNKAVTIKPDYPEAYNNMGNALKDQGKYEEAINAYGKALSLKPDFAEAYNNMGNALKEQGKYEEAINAYDKALSFKPDFAEAYNNATELLKIHLSKVERSNNLFKTDTKIKKLSSALLNVPPNDEMVISLLEVLGYIDEDFYEYKTPLSQIYRRNGVDLNCKRHIKIFDTEGIIPEFCFGCFKVQVEVPTVIDLMRLTALFYKFNFEIELTMKTMVELRPNIPGFYKGLIYCRGLGQANAVKTLLDHDLNGVFTELTVSTIKRGCSEYPLRFPDYGKISEEPKSMMTFPEEWKSVEENFDQREIIQPNLNVIASLKEFCLSDFYIIQKWVDYAKGIGDQSIEILNERPIVYKEIYERAKKRINL